MKVVYIAGPYRGDTRWQVADNVRNAERLGHRVALLGAMPLIPHTNTGPVWEGLFPDQFFLDGTMALMERCDAVIMTDDWERSEGAKAERKRAIELGIPVFTHVRGLGAWLEGN